MNKRQEYHQQSVFKRGTPEEKFVSTKSTSECELQYRGSAHVAPGEPGCVIHTLVDSRMETEDSWLLQATRLSNPLM